jgi:hypothetical protein
MTEPLRQKISDYVRSQYPKIVHKGEIERLAMGWGYEASHADRRCRDLVSEKIINKIPHPKRHAQYQYNMEKEDLDWWLQPEYRRGKRDELVSLF